ncbi:MAG: hypothetical protein MO846_08055 [Candidatus Devosia symbiotica]|nr:hypothetical protein [Candidatus Devosia symbiotica]
MLIDSLPQTAPDYSHEAKLKACGARIIADIDEAGRGPLIGPMVISAMVLDPEVIPAGLNDFKNSMQRSAKSCSNR